MKKVMLMVAVSFLVLGTSAVRADGPFLPGVQSDAFDPTPNGIPTPSAGDNPQVFESVNALLGTAYTQNNQIDGLEYTAGPTSIWQALGGGGFAVIGVSAGNLNTLSVYNTLTPGTKIDVFGGGFTGNGITGDGTALNPFPAAESPFVPGDEFGFSLASTGYTFDTWDSNVSLNSDGFDHMLTYHLTPLQGKDLYIQYTSGPNAGNIEKITLNDPYLIAWEDLPFSSSDQDYNDFVGIVDRAVPIPEPMTLTLFGAGLAGMIAARRKKLAV